MIRATTSAGCAEIRTFRKIGHFVHFGETGDSPDTLEFYFQHNKPSFCLGIFLIFGKVVE